MSLKQCCATGSLHTGTPTGRIEKIHGLDCYVADPPNGNAKGIVVIIPDAFGWTLPNNRILSDLYAKEGGFKVLLPEFHNGTSLPASSLLSLSAFRATGLLNQLYKIYHALYLIRIAVPFMYLNRPSAAGPRVWTFLRELKEHEGASLPIGTAGFCWGGHFVAKLCQDEIKAADGSRLTVCGFVAHPSFLSYPSDIDKIRLPFAVAASEFDMQMSKDQANQTRDILKAKTAKTANEGIEHEFVLYEGTHHGFAVRADEDLKHEAEQGEKARAQAVKWFSRWFANPPPVQGS